MGGFSPSTYTNQKFKRGNKQYLVFFPLLNSIGKWEVFLPLLIPIKNLKGVTNNIWFFSPFLDKLE